MSQTVVVQQSPPFCAADSNDGSKWFRALVKRLRDKEYAPPALKEEDIPAEREWSSFAWTGELDRFELVRHLRRCSTGTADGDLSEDLVDQAVRWFEQAEELAIAQRVEDAVDLFARILHRIPNSSLALYRFGLCCAVLDARRGRTSDDPPQAETVGAFRLASRLERRNRALTGNIDLVLRICAGVTPPNEYFSAAFPKSAGDVQLLATLTLSQPGVRRSLIATRRKRHADAAERRRDGSTAHES